MNPKNEGEMAAQVDVHYPVLLYGCPVWAERDIGSKAPQILRVVLCLQSTLTKGKQIVEQMNHMNASTYEESKKKKEKSKKECLEKS